ncbi:uncharacterized protein G2W53_043401 [Senna tora]|uniref:Uncharacterized protein n=1 Tax=Senna tora TaxID=362788 RepID=A0A834W0J6_9FABA|nr:uncharacterized protein G2W53_043401 [Senna tora]
MGNCLVLQENVAKIMKSDGKVLEYKTPIKVHQVLTQFSGHAISESFPVLRHLQPNAKLVGGQLYYLVPPAPSPKSGKKVRFANPEVVEEAKESSRVVRIKLVISKQELQNLLQKGGISVDMLSLVDAERGEDGEVMCNESEDVCQGWKPALESIPEIN